MEKNHKNNFSPNDIILGNYKLIKIIGKGSFGEVWKAQDIITDHYYAIKIVKKEGIIPANKNYIQIERKLLFAINHKNVMRIKKFVESKHNFYFVLELCKCTLLSITKSKLEERLTEREALGYLIQVIEGFQALHELGVLHRDIKLENLLMGLDGEIKIGDLGLARREQPNIKFSNLGTPLTKAPEVYEGKYDRKADLWSLGVCLYQMIEGTYPWGSILTILELRNAIEKKSGCFLKIKHASKEMSHLLKRMIDPNPATRMSWEQLAQFPLISNFGDNELIISKFGFKLDETLQDNHQMKDEEYEKLLQDNFYNEEVKQEDIEKFNDQLQVSIKEGDSYYNLMKELRAPETNFVESKKINGEPTQDNKNGGFIRNNGEIDMAGNLEFKFEGKKKENCFFNRLYTEIIDMQETADNYNCRAKNSNSDCQVKTDHAKKSIKDKSNLNKLRIGSQDQPNQRKKDCDFPLARNKSENFLPTKSPQAKTSEKSEELPSTSNISQSKFNKLGKSEICKTDEFDLGYSSSSSLAESIAMSPDSNLIHHYVSSEIFESNVYSAENSFFNIPSIDKDEIYSSFDSLELLADLSESEEPTNKIPPDTITRTANNLERKAYQRLKLAKSYSNYLLKLNEEITHLKRKKILSKKGKWKRVRNLLKRKFLCMCTLILESLEGKSDFINLEGVNKEKINQEKLKFEKAMQNRLNKFRRKLGKRSKHLNGEALLKRFNKQLEKKVVTIKRVFAKFNIDKLENLIKKLDKAAFDGDQIKKLIENPENFYKEFQNIDLEFEKDRSSSKFLIIE